MNKRSIYKARRWVVFFNQNATTVNKIITGNDILDALTQFEQKTGHKVMRIQSIPSDKSKSNE